jgi:hypothetical protein
MPHDPNLWQSPSFLLSLRCSGHHSNIDVTSRMSPARKKTNMVAINACVNFDAPFISFQTQTPQMAAIMVPPWQRP